MSSRRPPKPMPLALHALSYDIPSGKYKIREGEITYYFTLEHTRLLKQYYKINSSNSFSIAGFYNSLSKEDKKTVYREGYKSPTNDFFPDPEWND